MCCGVWDRGVCLCVFSGGFVLVRGMCSGRGVC